MASRRPSYPGNRNCSFLRRAVLTYFQITFARYDENVVLLSSKQSPSVPKRPASNSLRSGKFLSIILVLAAALPKVGIDPSSSFHGYFGFLTGHDHEEYDAPLPFLSMLFHLSRFQMGTCAFLPADIDRWDFLPFFPPSWYQNRRWKIILFLYLVVKKWVIPFHRHRLLFALLLCIHVSDGLFARSRSSSTCNCLYVAGQSVTFLLILVEMLL